MASESGSRADLICAIAPLDWQCLTMLRQVVEFSPLDPMQVMVLMLAGGVFALAGLWLMFRPKTDGHNAKIELFGMKFESSSAGLLVFLIGSAFLASPLFVRTSDTSEGETPTGPVVTTDNGTGKDPDDSTIGNVSTDTRGNQPRLLEVQPISVEGKEVEPNNTPASANRIPVGSSVTGFVTNTEADVFRIDTAGLSGSTLYVTLTGTNLDLQISLPSGKMATTESVGVRSSATAEATVEHDFYYARVTTYGVDAAYELTVTAQ